MRKEKKIELTITVAIIILFVLCVLQMAREVRAEPTLKPIDVTAYYDAYGHGYGADGRELIEGLTIAGRIQDLGKTAVLYDEDMRLIGIYEFRDVGYGQPTGRGKSKILHGKSLGSIESGLCVDIYMSNKNKCSEWGRRKCYIQIIDARG